MPFVYWLLSPSRGSYDSLCLTTVCPTDQMTSKIPNEGEDPWISVKTRLYTYALARTCVSQEPKLPGAPSHCFGLGSLCKAVPALPVITNNPLVRTVPAAGQRQPFLRCRDTPALHVDARGSLGSGSSPRGLISPAFCFQVKIWFQNKRSKFKKLLKQGSNPHESDPLPGSAALSPRSPALPPVWDVSASTKGVNMPPNSYMPGYSHWYSSPHQDTMQRPQMM